MTIIDTSLMTTPREIKKNPPIFLTGNEYVSLPEIDPSGGGLLSLNMIHYNLCGLIEFTGEGRSPLLEPLLMIDGLAVKLRRMRWYYKHHWIPNFNSSTSGLEVKGSVVAPLGQRGFLYKLTITNQTNSNIMIKGGWKGCWGNVLYTVFNRRPVKGEHHQAYYDKWTRSIVLEARQGTPLASLALAPQDPHLTWEYNVDNKKDFPKKFSITGQEQSLAPDEVLSINLFGAVNREADGASTTTMHLKRLGADHLENKTATWLKEKISHLNNNPLEGMVNRNKFFCYFYSTGRSIDNDKPVYLTSRSPRYYVSAAFWSRDALLWSFPAVLMLSPDGAAEMLETCFKRHLHHPGDHAHYLNGTPLYPGFELDQLAAFILALRLYINKTNHYEITNHRDIQQGLDKITNTALQWYSPETGLYKTFLDPSDDPPVYPYIIYDNALLQQSWQFIGELQNKGLYSHDNDFNGMANQLKKDIYKYGVVQGPFGQMFAWAVDGTGNYELYDNPPGSLQLLGHYGFCGKDNEIFLNTVKWIRSIHNPFFHHRGHFREPGCRHSPHPWPLSVANDLLALNIEKGKNLQKAILDNGFCCETVHVKNGTVATGRAFASGAGFLAYAIQEAEGNGSI